MLRRYRFFSRTKDEDFTADRRGAWGRDKMTRLWVHVVRAERMEDALRMAREGEWADGPDSPGVIRRLDGRKLAEWTEAPYLREDFSEPDPAG